MGQACRAGSPAGHRGGHFFQKHAAEQDARCIFFHFFLYIVAPPLHLELSLSSAAVYSHVPQLGARHGNHICRSCLTPSEKKAWWHIYTLVARNAVGDGRCVLR